MTRAQIALGRCTVLACLALAVACAPTVEGPVDKQRAADALDARRLTAQLAVLPGVARAEVMLRRSVRDPLAMVAPAPASISMVLIVDDRADRAKLEQAARRLAGAIVDVEPAIVVEVGVERAELARVGPFTVAQRSRGPLKTALAIALGLIASLAGWIAWSYRRGNSAQ